MWCFGVIIVRKSKFYYKNTKKIDHFVVFLKCFLSFIYVQKFTFFQKSLQFFAIGYVAFYKSLLFLRGHPPYL